jgi:hypothetical protein
LTSIGILSFSKCKEKTRETYNCCKVAAWEIAPPSLQYVLKNSSKKLTFSKGISATVKASNKSWIIAFFDSEEDKVVTIHETEIKSPKSKYFGLEAQSRN